MLAGATRGGAAVVVLGAVVVGGAIAVGFPVRGVEVAGAPKPQTERVAEEVRAAIGSTSLLRVDAGSLATRLEQLPEVRSVRIDRAFPGTLAVQVAPEVAAAVVPLGKERYVVARSGRVIGPATARTALPFLAAAPVDVPPPGGTIRAPGVRSELEVARAIPPRLGIRIIAVEVTQRGLVARTRQGVELRLGDAADLGEKLRAAASALAALPRDGRRGVQYVDVTVPERPAVRTAEANPSTLAPSAAIQLPELAAEDATTDDGTDAAAADEAAAADAAALDPVLAPDVPALVQDLFGRMAA